MALRLTIAGTHGPKLGTLAVKEFGPNGGTIGRSLECDWALPDSKRYLSSRHASIDFRSGSYYVIDTSMNGVFVNDADQPVGRGKPQRLFDGDRLRIGEYEITVEIDEDPISPLIEENHIDPVDLAQRVEAPEPTGNDMVDAYEITGVGIEMMLTDDELETLSPPPKSKGAYFEIVDDVPPAKKRAAAPSAAVAKASPAPIAEPGPSAAPAPGPAPAAQPTALATTHIATDADVLELLDGTQPATLAPRPPAAASGAPPAARQAPAEAAAQPRAAAAKTKPPARRASPQSAGQAAPASAPKARAQGAAAPKTPAPSAAAPRGSASGAAQPAPRSAAAPARPTPLQDGPALDLEPFFRGARVSARVPPEESDAFLFRLGQVMRMMIVGLTETLHLHADQKNALGLTRATGEPQDDNPLKLRGGFENAFAALLLQDSANVAPVDAVREAFDDLMLHQQLAMKAIRAALDAFVARLDPEELEQKFARGRSNVLVNAANRLKYWDLYKDLYDVVAHHPPGELPMQFVEDFAEAYQRELEHARGADAAPERQAG